MTSIGLSTPEGAKSLLVCYLYGTVLYRDLVSEALSRTQEVGGTMKTAWALDFNPGAVLYSCMALGKPPKLSQLVFSHL